MLKQLAITVFPFMLQNYPESDSWKESGEIVQVSYLQNNFYSSFYSKIPAILPEDTNLYELTSWEMEGT